MASHLLVLTHLKSIESDILDSRLICCSHQLALCMAVCLRERSDRCVRQISQVVVTGRSLILRLVSQLRRSCRHGLGRILFSAILHCGTNRRFSSGRACYRCHRTRLEYRSVVISCQLRLSALNGRNAKPRFPGGSGQRWSIIRCLRRS